MRPNQPTFLFTCVTPETTPAFLGSDVYSNDLMTIEDYCIAMGEDHGYSYVRNNVTNEIVFTHGAE